jgi:hypothetical protein
MSPDSCVLDILSVRIPAAEAEASRGLWDEIDEQPFPPELRRRLARNGFRAGLVSGQMPLKLARVLELDDKPVPTGESNQIDLEDLESSPTVVPWHVQIRPGKRREIQTSPVYDELPVLRCESGGLCGRSYPKAQGVIALKTFCQPDGRVQLELVPELHYGDFGQQIVGDRHAFRFDTSRPRRVFSEMTVSATLTRGDMLVISSLPDCPGSLGHYFFTQESSGREERKLYVIRLAQTQHDDLFDPDRLLAMEP